MSSRNRLRNVNVSDDEFNHLRNHFFDEIFIRDKIFDKSMPKEFDSFSKFIDQTKPFDIVIDGLNVAYSTQTVKPLVAANIVRNFFFCGFSMLFSSLNETGIEWINEEIQFFSWPLWWNILPIKTKSFWSLDENLWRIGQKFRWITFEKMQIYFSPKTRAYKTKINLNSKLQIWKIQNSFHADQKTIHFFCIRLWKVALIRTS